ncbi:hypothetical protein ACYJ1Y_17505 [Natrialbaceae archaeon A-gly3]
MQRRSVIATVGAVLGTSVGAAAYTSATVNRDASFTVATDATDALIGLNEGTTDGVDESGDSLEISIENLNTDGSFTFGDGSNVDTSYAFTITNNDSESRTIDVDYDTAQVDFEIYEEGETDWTDATAVGTVNESNEPVSLSASTGQEFRVVLTVDTDGIGSSDASLDGTLTFTAN